MTGPTVFLVDDHDLFRAGVRSEIGDAVHIIGEADQVDAAIELILERRPDVVLLDVHMPAGGGRAVLEAVHAAHPDIKFLALSVSDAPEDVVDIVHAGARGYVTKSIQRDALIDAIHRVAEGDAVFSPKLAGFVLDAFSALEPADVDAELASLTAASKKCCVTSPAATPTRRWATSCSSPSRRWRRTSRPSCASSSSPTAMSSPAGRPSAG